MLNDQGRFSFWGITAYCMSKFAVRSFSDGLRRELNEFGVKVVTIEPNMYRTEIMDLMPHYEGIDKLWQRTDSRVREDYGGDQFCNRLKNRLKFNIMISRPQIHEVVDTQELSITLCEPELYYRCASIWERPSLWFLSVVPESLQDILLTGRVWKRVLNFYKQKE